MAGIGGFYYYTTQSQLSNLQTSLENEKKINAAFEVREKEQTRTIEALEQSYKKTSEALQQQSARNAEIQAEMNRYLDIFNRHDLSKLAAAKPGLIEKRINKGTKDVFKSIEDDSTVVNSTGK